MLKWFKVLIEWLESESGAELYTLTELHSKMVKFSDGNDAYTMKRLKQKLQEHNKELIFFANVEGHENVVCFKNMAKYIINEKGHHHGTAWRIKLSGLYLLQQKSYMMKSEKISMIVNLTQPMKTLHLLVKAVSGFLIIYKLSLNLLLFQM